MSYIDALIPGGFGMVMVIWPGLFTKAEGDEADRAIIAWRRRGPLLLGVAALALILRIARDS